MAYVKDGDRADPHVAALTGGLFRALNAAMAERGWADARTSHLRFLDALDPEGNSVSELSARLWMTPQAVGQFVTQLVESGLVQVQRDSSDGRRRVIALTAHGHATVRRMQADLADVDRAWAATIGADRYATFRAALADLVAPHLKQLEGEP